MYLKMYLYDEKKVKKNEANKKMKNRRKYVHFYVIIVCFCCSCAYVTVFIETKPYGNENAENNAKRHQHQVNYSIKIHWHKSNDMHEH